MHYYYKIIYIRSFLSYLHVNILIIQLKNPPTQRRFDVMCGNMNMNVAPKYPSYQKIDVLTMQ